MADKAIGDVITLCELVHLWGATGRGREAEAELGLGRIVIGLADFLLAAPEELLELSFLPAFQVAAHEAQL